MKQLFLIPHAGGSIVFYKKFIDLINESYDVRPFEYSGHGTRMKEPLYKNFDELLDDFDRFFTKNRILDEDYYFFSYSMGTIVNVMYMMKRIKKCKLPKVIFLCSHMPPIPMPVDNNPADMNDDEFYDFVSKLGGIDYKTYTNPIFKRIYLPIIKNDYRLLYNCDYSLDKKTIDTNLVIMCSPTDPMYEYMDNWKDYTTKDIEKYEFSGGHFFINDHYNEVAEILNKRK